MRVRHIYISPGHNFFGHHEQPPGEHPMIEVESVRCMASKGLEDDRFFDFKKDYKGQVTFFAWEIYLRLCTQLGMDRKSPGVFRRNVITEGVDLNVLIGKEFEIQGVRFFGTAECSPCHWMDHAFAPGAEKALHGNGGLRAKILTDGVLRAER